MNPYENIDPMLNDDNQLHLANNIFYLAFMSLDYEGIFESSIRLFKNKPAAEKYICDLKKLHGSDFVTYDIMELFATNEN